ncbi:UNVERIFIED_ORG: hypothetical protein L601_002500000030 [Gordonia westfalica J30]
MTSIVAGDTHSLAEAGTAARHLCSDGPWYMDKPLHGPPNAYPGA